MLNPLWLDFTRPSFSLPFPFSTRIFTPVCCLRFIAIPQQFPALLQRRKRDSWSWETWKRSSLKILAQKFCSIRETVLLLWIRYSLRLIFRSGGSPTHKLAKIHSPSRPGLSRLFYNFRRRPQRCLACYALERRYWRPRPLLVTPAGSYFRAFWKNLKYTYLQIASA